MPRIAAVNAETMYEVLKDMPVFEANGQLKKKNDPIWKEAVQYMPETSAHNVYFFVFQNRRDIKTNLMKYMNIQPPPMQIKKKKRKLKRRAPKYIISDDDNCHEMLNSDNLEYELEYESCNDLKVLNEMRHSEVYSNIIHKISMSPFSVYYWYPEQITLWTDLINIESSLSFLVLDNIIADYTSATDVESSKVFLYALAVKVKKSVMLVGQMMSNSVSASEIQCFFNTWIQKTAPAPLELVIDYSYNLLNAASLAFNFCTFNEYNIRCFKYLRSELETLPSTLIRVDMIGLINVIDKWICFDDVLQPIKDFYLSSIIYISTVDNLAEFEETIISILALCQSPYQTIELEIRRLNLCEHLTKDATQQTKQSFIDYETGKYGERNFSSLNQTTAIDTIDSFNEIYTYIEQLKKKAIDICNMDNAEKISNQYFCPSITDSFIKLIIHFPSWTNIVFNKDNCAPLVSICSTKLTYLFQYLKEPLSFPNFVIYHLEKLKVTTKEGLTYISNLKRRNVFPVKEELILTSGAENNGNDIDMSNQEIKSVAIDESEVKNTLHSIFEALFDFNETVENILRLNISSDQEKMLCKLILDTCTETKTYEKFIGMIAEKLCSNSDAFALSFKKMFMDCYNTAELLNKLELKNITKLFAQLLMSDSLSWTILTILKLNENTSTAKKNFIRILLCELRHHMGSNFKRKFDNFSFRTTLKGLFPTHRTKDINFACAFYRSIGLSLLANIVKKPENVVQETNALSRSSSNSSISSTSSCEFAVEIKVRKKRDGSGLSIETNPI